MFVEYANYEYGFYNIWVENHGFKLYTENITLWSSSSIPSSACAEDARTRFTIRE